jgi:pimeloyl-ACP methyl ester carboxylesterase
MPKLSTNNTTLYYETHGQGQPLLLIAGLGYSSWVWRWMVPGLAERLQVIVFDNRGVGQSDIPPGPYTAGMLAEDAAGLLQALGIEQAAVLGHSMGGYVAQQLALSRPELVSHLILASTNFGGPNSVPPSPEALAILTDISGDAVTRFRRGLAVSVAPGFAQRRPELIEEWLQWRTDNPVQPEGYQAQLAVGLSLFDEANAFEQRLSQIEAPALVLFGAHDQVIPAANAELLANRLPNSTTHIIANAGHFFPIEAPEEAVRVVVEFVESGGW